MRHFLAEIGEGGPTTAENSAPSGGQGNPGQGNKDVEKSYEEFMAEIGETRTTQIQEPKPPQHMPPAMPFVAPGYPIPAYGMYPPAWNPWGWMPPPGAVPPGFGYPAWQQHTPLPQQQPAQSTAPPS